MPLKQLAYVPNHIKLTRDVAVDLLIKPTAKIKDISTVTVKLSGKHADDLLTFEATGSPRSHRRPPTKLFGFDLIINEAGNGSTTLGQL